MERGGAILSYHTHVLLALMTLLNIKLLPVVDSFSSSPVFLIERAAYPLFGVNGYGVHVNGWVRQPDADRPTHLWIGTRAKTKSTWPGMLDHIVAGAQPYGISPSENVVKECAEEANIPLEIARRAKSVGAVSYMGLDEKGLLKRDSLFCFDLELPVTFLINWKNENPSLSL